MSVVGSSIAIIDSRTSRVGGRTSVDYEMLASVKY